MPAGLFRRLAAMIYDGLLILALLISTLTLMVVLTNAPVAGHNVLALLFIESFAFLAYFWIFRGQTLGMLAWGLYIVSLDGYRITFTQAMLRYFVGVASLLPLGLGYLWLYVDPDRRTWPDMASGSSILYRPRPRRR
ncbi:MAG: RDD family protein [Pseudomonadales bacterium]